MFRSTRRKRARPRLRARGGTHVELMLETLEALLLPSASPYDLTYEAWREQEFTVGSIDLASTAVATAMGDVGAFDAAALGLIGVSQVSQQNYYTGAGYSVAVIDTGVLYTHPAFQGRYLGGYDFVDNDADPMDLNGHGTHVAGIIASANSTYRGVASGAGIIALRVLDASGSGSFGAVESALQWVIAHRAQYNIVAVNMSLGAGNYTTNPYAFLDDELQTLKNQGVFTAAAAGNSFYSYGSQQGLGYPAIAGLSVSVGAVYSSNYGSVSWGSGAQDATTAPDRIASFSQRSANLNILAPGAMIVSTYLNNSYAALAGTSMATPFVAGAAVVLRQALDAAGRTSLANQDGILSIMRSTGVTLVDGDDENDNVVNTGLSFRRLNLGAAVQFVVNGGTVPAPAPSNPTSTYLDTVFRHVLGRVCDTGSKNALTAALNSGMPRQQLTYAMWVSAEHRGQQIDLYYTTYLARQPSPAERDAWQRAFQAGATETTLIRAFLNSAEYSSRFPGNSTFVSRVYQDVLLRTADTGGLAAWTAALNAGLPRSRLVESFLGSDERIHRLVDRQYQDFLGRVAGESDKQYWRGMLQTGRASTGQLTQLILASQEYYNRAVGGAFSGTNQPRALDAQSPIDAPLDVASAALFAGSGSALTSAAPVSAAASVVDVRPWDRTPSRSPHASTATPSQPASAEAALATAARVDRTIDALERALDEAVGGADEDELDDLLQLLAERRGLA